jgi:diguanylate cyclase
VQRLAVVLLLALLVAYLTVPALAGVVYQLVGLGSAVSILALRARRRAWTYVAVALLLFWAGDTIWSAYPLLTGHDAPFPSVADVAYLGAYPVLLLASLALRGRRTGGRTALLDTAILAVPVAAVLWVVSIQPTLDANAGAPPLAAAVSLSYPLADLVLLASLARLLMAPGRLSPATRLLTLALAAQLLADVVYVEQSLAGTYVEGTWVDALWLLAYGAMALAARHPTPEPAGVVDDDVPTPRRVVVLGIALLAGPAALLLQDAHGHGLAGAAWLVVTGLVVVRMHGLGRSLTHLAMHDPVTDLPNRTAFGRVLAAALEADAGATLLFCDLDGFQLVNDGLGHATGDRMLREVGTRLRRGLGPDDVVGRFGGDEFVVLSPGTGGVAGAQRLADEVERLLGDRFPVPGSGDLAIGISVGAVVIPAGTGATTDADVVLEEADTAMYRAKDTGRPEVVVASGGGPRASLDRLQTVSELRGVVARGELRLHFQPELTVDGGELFGFEALVRWEHPTRGLLPPAAFITEAERTGEITRIGAWALDQACAQLASWARSGATPTVAVNVSARQLSDPDFPTTVLDAIRRHGVDPAALVLEITETSAVADVDLTRRALLRLKEIGVAVAIDDFGTGHSSLSQLRRLPVDFLKIDRSFVQSLDTSSDDQAIVTAIVSMAGAMGMRTVAEGVERPAQLDLLRRVGCDLAQGFLLGRPGAASADGSGEALIGAFPAAG